MIIAKKTTTAKYNCYCTINEKINPKREKRTKTNMLQTCTSTTSTMTDVYTVKIVVKYKLNNSNCGSYYLLNGELKREKDTHILNEENYY